LQPFSFDMPQRRRRPEAAFHRRAKRSFDLRLRVTHMTTISRRLSGIKS
jgi:hypothetical protein